MALNKEFNFYEKNSATIKNTFQQLHDILKKRELQLLKQIEAIDQKYKLTDSYDDKRLKEIVVVFKNKGDIIESLANFGQIDSQDCDNDVFHVNDYQPKIKDISLNKYEDDSSSEQLTVKNETNNNECPQLINNEKQNGEIIPNKGSNVSHSILECIEKNDSSLCQHIIKENDIKAKCISICDNSKNSNCTNSLVNILSTPNVNCKCSSNDKISKSIQISNDIISLQENKPHNENQIEDSNYIHINEKIKMLSIKQSSQIQQWIKEIVTETEIEPLTHNMEYRHIETVHKHIKQ